ncbi:MULTISPECIES: Rha family transcriptional regulator [unclassified Acinetobacter]|uniref:Rha family transcriptional regulator n=1 Tax=unclassified Acinetobacter TaxID=196816 RepID=UPI0015D3C7C3|nr:MULTISPECIES: phage antirepressor KilAC domain-containing protein [unclassified Acinetobacter]
MTNLSLQTANSTPYNTAINTSISVVATPTVQTMSSKEISELTGKRHGDVIRDIRNMIEQLQNAKMLSGFYQENKALNGMTSDILLDKGLSTCLVSGYNIPLRMAIVNRWEELEKQAMTIQPQLPNFLDPAEAAFAWGKQYQATQLAEAKLLEAAKAIEVMQPTVDAYELIAGKKGSMCFQDAYKYLGGIKLKDMKQWMYDKGWIKKDRFGRDSIGYYQNMSGYLVEKVTTHQPQIRITYKGLAAMARQMKIKLNAEDFN